MKYLIIFILVSCGYNDCCYQDKSCHKNKANSKIISRYRWNNHVWDAILLDEIGRTGINRLVIRDAKKFGIVDAVSLGRVFVEIAYWESKFNVNSSYLESTGHWSRGLFQLSLVDGRRYGCKFQTERDVMIPERNIRCAVKIMYQLVARDHHIAGIYNRRWLGGSRYWSVLRGTRRYTRNALRAIRSCNMRRL